MEPVLSAPYPPPPVCAMGWLSGNSRLGFGVAGSTVHQGLKAGKYLIAVGDTNSLVGNAWLESLKAQQQNSQTQDTQPADNTLLAQNQPPPPPGRTPAQGLPPDTPVVIPDGKGGSTTRIPDSDGKAVKDIDRGHDHGAGDPHAHDWDWTKKPPRQPGRPLTPEEQKNLKRAAGGVSAGVIIYWIISEATRLFPPRNLIPVP